MHIVAPPGSGKTVIGLWLWAELIRKPALVLSPNSAIQSQWAARTDLFKSALPQKQLVSTAPQSPALLTSLTYQSVTMPSRNNVAINDLAIERWQDALVEEGQALDIDEANVWIDDLRTSNNAYFQQRFGVYKKKVRDEATISGKSMSLLHSSSQATLQRIADRGVGVIILDECHHLLGHWGRVLSDALPLLGNPVVIGLTATPPDKDGKDSRDVERYESFFGEVDFEVPVPAVVKDGFLSPYQDLAWFVRPTNEELKFVASADRRLKELVEAVCFSEPSSSPSRDAVSNFEDSHSEEPVADESDERPVGMLQWLEETLATLRLPTGHASEWAGFAKRDPSLALSARQFLSSRKLAFPKNVPPLSPLEESDLVPPMEYWVPVLDRYVRHYLRRTSAPQYKQLANQIISTLRTLGTQITETGTRACVSPVGRVMAWSKNKTNAVVPILQQEIENLGDSIRAVVIADFERSSAVTAELKSLMDDETGGAIAAFKTLLTTPETDSLEPILLTGSTILVDDEIEAEFLKQSAQWLSERNLQVELESKPTLEFRQIIGRGSDWSPRVYVEMVTELFQRGLSKCLVGTRGLLGEGWDANRINVLIDLTTVTTSMSINQLRGRSFRLDPKWPEKLANNWDVVCIAPEFSKGFDDYRRFRDKHQNLFGVTDDGAIEKGVGHVHPAFTDIKPEGLESTVALLNTEMIQRSAGRDHVRKTWKIGQPFLGRAVRAVELKPSEPSGGFPPFAKRKDPWCDETLTSAIGMAVLKSLVDLKLVSSEGNVKSGLLSGGYVRVFLENASEEESEIFSDAMKQVLGPLDRPRYVIPRVEHQQIQTLLSRFLPGIIGRYFVKQKEVFAMLHPVPSSLCKNKSAVAVFQSYWNQFVSPGEAMFALRGEGEKLVEATKRNQRSIPMIHEKEIFH